MTNKVAFMNENDNDSHLDLQQFFYIFTNKKYLFQKINKIYFNKFFIYCLLLQNINPI